MDPPAANSIPPPEENGIRQNDHSEDSPVAEKSTLLCGYLNKLSGNGPLRSFKKRWFIYSPDDCRLKYYRAKGDLITKGDIDIRKATFTIDPKGPEGGQFNIPQLSSETSLLTFSIITPDKSYHLQGIDQRTTLFWINELQRLRKEYIMNLAKDFGVQLKPHVLGSGGQNDVNVVEVSPVKKELERRDTVMSTSSTFYLDTSEADSTSVSRRSSLSGSQLPAVKPPASVIRESRSQDQSKRRSVGFGSRVMAGLRQRAESMTRNSSQDVECKKCIELSNKMVSMQDELEAVLNEFQASREVIHLLQRQLDASQKECESVKELLKSQDVSNDMITKLSSLENQMHEQTASYVDMKRKYTKLTAEHEVLKQNHESNVDQVSILCDTIESKDKSIYALTNELYERDGHNIKNVSNIKTSDSNVTFDYQSEMEKLRDSLTAYKMQNDFLNKEIVEINEIRNLGERRIAELSSKSSEWEARCCQIQSKLLSLLKEINTNIESRNELVKDSQQDNQAKVQVTLTENTVNLVLRLLEDISIDIPLSWKRGNRSRNEEPTINLASRVSDNYDDLGFSHKSHRNVTDESISDPYEGSPLVSDSSVPINRVSDKVEGSGGSQAANEEKQTTPKTAAITSANWKSRWDAYVGGLGPSQDLQRTVELKHLLRGGIPREYRCKIWKGLINLKVKSRRESLGPDYYSSLLNSKSTAANLSTSPGSSLSLYDPIIKQIELDLLRTLPDNKHFESLESDGTCRLRRVLIAYSRHNPSVGYCQGLNRLAAVSLLFMPEEDAFWALVSIVEHLMPPDYYSTNLLGAHVDQHVFRDLLSEKLPALSAHLASYGVEVSLFSWFLTCFIDNIPVDVYLRIWDVFLYEGNKILFRFALAFFKLHESQILASHDSMAINTLIRTIGEKVVNVKQLCKIAFSLLNPFPMSKVRAKRVHYTNIVKGELDKLDQMRKTLPRNLQVQEEIHEDED